MTGLGSMAGLLTKEMHGGGNEGPIENVAVT